MKSVHGVLIFQEQIPLCLYLVVMIVRYSFYNISLEVFFANFTGMRLYFLSDISATMYVMSFCLIKTI